MDGGQPGGQGGHFEGSQLEGLQLAGLQLAPLAPAFGVVDVADTLRKRAVATPVLASVDACVLLTTVAAAPVLVAALDIPAGLHCFWGAQAAAAAQHWALAWEKKVAQQKSAAINKVMRIAIYG